MSGQDFQRLLPPSDRRAPRRTPFAESAKQLLQPSWTGSSIEPQSRYYNVGRSRARAELSYALETKDAVAQLRRLEHALESPVVRCNPELERIAQKAYAENKCPRAAPPRPPRLVIIAGPPAAGKGTQCEFIKTAYNSVHLSTGDMLRDNVKAGTELGKKAKKYMDAGDLVPSELIIDIVKDRLEQSDVKSRGCLLDGFPRAPDQAEAMANAGFKVDNFILINVPDEVLVERGCGRRLDPETGEIYHLKFKPPPPEIEGRLQHRSDDKEDKIRNRLRTYHSQIHAIIPYFKDVVTGIDGVGHATQVFMRIRNVLDAKLVVIAGAPAAGKGTQCELMKAKYGFVHLSTGDILRENVKSGTRLGKEAKKYMDSGALVPDGLIIDLVKDRLNKADVKECGCLLDGFPRTADQARAMVDAGLHVDHFVLINVPDAVLVERSCGRRLDPKTGKIYHIKFKPPPADIVDRLEHRSDDHEDKVRARLKAFHSQINAILPYFNSVLTKVEGTGSQDGVFKLIRGVLDT